MPETSGRSETPATSLSLGYQPALDGVRAAAVVLVVLFHYPWGSAVTDHFPFHGGFLGVDIFFVLSGFLITTLLVREFSTSGGMSLRNFYARRALRLLPALAVLLCIAAVFCVTLAKNNDNRPSGLALVSIVFDAGNWMSISHPASLGVAASTWSLALEEQFYIVWPLLLLLLLQRRLRIRMIAAVIAAGIAASAAWGARYWHDRITHLDFTNPVDLYGDSGVRRYAWNRIYFGSDTRADALLAGCLAAILLPSLLSHVHGHVGLGLTAAAAIAVVVITVMVIDATMVVSAWLPEWGFLVLALCTAVLIAGLVAAPTSVLARAFAARPLVWIGRRSYAIYLFNEVVFWAFDRSRVHLVPPLSFLFQMGMILVVADVSYRVVEGPMLRRKRRFEPTPSSRRVDAAT